MNKMIKKNTIFGDFKLGDKVWYQEPGPPFGKIPGVVEKDKIQYVGKSRDKFIKEGVEPFVHIETIPEVNDFVKRRRKMYPGEVQRLRLQKFGMEEEYVKWKKDLKKEPKLTFNERELLNKIKSNIEEQSGVWVRTYSYEPGAREIIQRLERMGLVYRIDSRRVPGEEILVPVGIEPGYLDE